jgi:nucleoside 2-deoxyribosyltransferase
MKIYFSVPMISGKSLSVPYLAIRDFLKGMGHELLTERLLEEDAFAKDRELPRNHIFKRDLNWIKRADLVLAEVSVPSTGIGYEIAHALNLRKKVLCLAQEGAPVTAMIEGNEKLSFLRYKSTQEALILLEGFLEKARPARKKSRARKTINEKKGRRQAWKNSGGKSRYKR